MSLAYSKLFLSISLDNCTEVCNIFIKYSPKHSPGAAYPICRLSVTDWTIGTTAGDWLQHILEAMFLLISITSFAS